MAKKRTKKSDAQAEEGKVAAKADEPAAKEWIEQRAAEEQAKMDNSAVKDVTYDPVFTPAAADPDAVTSRSKSVPPADPDWKEKMDARGKADALPHNATAAQDAAEEGRTGKTAAHGKVDAKRVAANEKSARGLASRAPANGRVATTGDVTRATNATGKPAGRAASRGAKAASRASGRTATRSKTVGRRAAK